MVRRAHTSGAGVSPLHSQVTRPSVHRPCRLHLRKCQCREKTPPCRNCPKCKDNVDIMSLTDIHAQFSVCQLKFRCEICSCKYALLSPLPCLTPYFDLHVWQETAQHMR